MDRSPKSILGLFRPHGGHGPRWGVFRWWPLLYMAARIWIGKPLYIGYAELGPMGLGLHGESWAYLSNLVEQLYRSIQLGSQPPDVRNLTFNVFPAEKLCHQRDLWTPVSRGSIPPENPQFLVYNPYLYFPKLIKAISTWILKYLGKFSDDEIGFDLVDSLVTFWETSDLQLLIKVMLALRQKP